MLKLNQKLLHSIPIFSNLEEKDILLLQNISTLLSLESTQILFYEGDESENLYILLDGNIEIFKTDNRAKEIVLKQFSPFSFIAEVSNYNHIPFPASARAIGDIVVLQIDYQQFEQNFLHHPRIAPFIIKSMASKVLVLEKLISENLTMNATQRIAKFIFENENFFLEQKHHLIANKLNITPVTLSRILKTFKEKNILSNENKILDKNLLKKEFC